MSLFRKTPKIKNRAVLDHAKHRLLKYVIARDAAGCEVVLGRSGRINVQDRELIISCEGRDVFRCDVEQMEIGEMFMDNHLPWDSIKPVRREMVNPGLPALLPAMVA